MLKNQFCMCYLRFLAALQSQTWQPNVNLAQQVEYQTWIAEVPGSILTE